MLVQNPVHSFQSSQFARQSHFFPHNRFPAERSEQSRFPMVEEHEIRNLLNSLSSSESS